MGRSYDIARGSGRSSKRGRRPGELICLTYPSLCKRVYFDECIYVCMCLQSLFTSTISFLLNKIKYERTKKKKKSQTQNLQQSRIADAICKAGVGLLALVGILELWH